jgi:hypothetical protein
MGNHIFAVLLLLACGQAFAERPQDSDKRKHRIEAPSAGPAGKDVPRLAMPSDKRS